MNVYARMLVIIMKILYQIKQFVSFAKLLTLLSVKNVPLWLHFKHVLFAILLQIEFLIQLHNFVHVSLDITKQEIQPFAKFVHHLASLAKQPLILALLVLALQCIGKQYFFILFFYYKKTNITNRNIQDYIYIYIYIYLFNKNLRIISKIIKIIIIKINKKKK